MIREEDPNVLVLRDLGFGACRLSICGAKDRPLSELTHGSRIATKFTHCTREYFEALGIKVDIIKLYGSVELAAITGLSDFVIDLVATGETLKENGLKEQVTIFESTAQLVANPVFFSLHFEEIQRFIHK
jgi:ATP phosphoribosyltransferase